VTVSQNNIGNANRTFLSTSEAKKYAEKLKAQGKGAKLKIKITNK
jgi:hypothetical protein